MDLKKIKQKIVGTFIGTGGKEKNKERQQFINTIKDATSNFKNINSNFKNINSKTTIENLSIIEKEFLSEIDIFKENLKKFRDTEVRKNKTIKSESYNVLNTFILSLSKTDLTGYKKMTDFYEQLTNLIINCKKVPQYALIGGKGVQESLKELQVAVSSFVNRIYSENIKSLQQNASASIKTIFKQNVNIVLDITKENPIQNFKLKSMLLYNDLSKQLKLFPKKTDTLIGLYKNLEKLSANLKLASNSEISFFGTDIKFNSIIKGMLDAIVDIFSMDLKCDIDPNDKNIIFEYLNELKKQIQLSKEKFYLKKEYLIVENDVINIIINLNKTDFYNKICDNNYKKSKNIIDEIIIDIRNTNKILANIIDNGLKKIESKQLWKDFTNILSKINTQLKKELKTDQDIKELSSELSISIDKLMSIKILSNHESEFIQENTKVLIKNSFEAFLQSCKNLSQTVNIILKIPEDTTVKNNIIAELENLWVVDQNKTGNYLTNSGNLNISELKELFEKRNDSNFLKKHSRTYGPQNAFLIANGTKMDIQVNRHATYFLTLNRTANYVLIDSNGKIQHGDKYPGEKNNRINNNNNNNKSAQEVTNYLKNVLYYGRFENNKSWLSSAPDLTEKRI